jgi:hypothetical protein
MRTSRSLPAESGHKDMGEFSDPTASAVGCCRCRVFAAWWVRLWVFFVTVPRRTHATMQEGENFAIGTMMPASDQMEPRRVQIGARLAWGLCVASLMLVVLGLIYGAWSHSLRTALALEAPNAIWAVSFPWLVP